MKEWAVRVAVSEGLRPIIDKVKPGRLSMNIVRNLLIMTPMDNMNIIRILRELGLYDFSDIYKNEAIV